MTKKTKDKNKLTSKENCGVCGNTLIYGTESKEMRCAFCYKTFNAVIYCPEGHYICDSCHEREALDILRGVVASSTSKDPIEIFEIVVSHPSVTMHGPEHHAIVPVSIVAAVKNSGYKVPDNALEKAITRGSAVPGGWCGSHGACGAAIGAGIAVNVLNGATPLKGEERSLANKMTSFALDKMVDGDPRCCKRAGRKEIEAAIEFLSNNMGIILSRGEPIKCNYSHRNQQCIKDRCSYHISE